MPADWIWIELNGKYFPSPRRQIATNPSRYFGEGPSLSGEKYVAKKIRRAVRMSPLLPIVGLACRPTSRLPNSTLPVSAVSTIPGSPSTLPGLSRKVANLELYYEKHGWSAPVAERYRSSFTGEAVSLFDQLGYTKILADKQTDFQAGYDFPEGRWHGLSVLLQIYDLTNSANKTQQISNLPNNVQVARPLDYVTWGRTVMFGLNYRL